MFLLDTNVLSEFRRARPHGAVVAWLERLPSEVIFIPSIALFEIQAGIERTRARDPSKAQEIERWLEGIAATLQIISADAQVMRTWARLMHRRPRELLEDALVAATAQVRQLTVATRNMKHFRLLGVPAVNPFAFPSA